MKYDFNNSRYAQLWQEANVVLATYINSEDLLRRNYNFWREKFSVKPETVVRGDDGTSVYTVKSYDRTAAPMLDLRAPLGKAAPEDLQGVSSYYAPIPDFISSTISENTLQRIKKEEMFRMTGVDTDIIDALTDKIQTRYDSANATLSNLSAQLLSTGECKWTFGRGIKDYLHNAELPTANRKNAGEMAWTEKECKLLSQAAKIEQDFRFEKGFDGAMVWEVVKKEFYDVWLNNAQVIEWIKQYRTLRDQVVTATMPITEDMFREAIASYSGLSPIVLVEERQRDTGWNGSKDVHGWKAGVAVLRPAGYAGEVVKSDILDIQVYKPGYTASNMTKVFAPIEGGLMYLVNTTMDNGELKEWHTNLVLSATPALTEVPYHVIVNTLQAG